MEENKKEKKRKTESEAGTDAKREERAKGRTAEEEIEERIIKRAQVDACLETDVRRLRLHAHTHRITANLSSFLSLDESRDPSLLVCALNVKYRPLVPFHRPPPTSTLLSCCVDEKGPSSVCFGAAWRAEGCKCDSFLSPLCISTPAPSRRSCPFSVLGYLTNIILFRGSDKSC